MRGLTTALATFALFSGAARADGLIYQLPEDRSWALYKTEASEDKSHRGGQIRQMTGSLKMSSVGVETIDGEKYRWIETEEIYRGQDDPASTERGRAYKWLIPEKRLQRGNSPADGIVRGWRENLGQFAGESEQPREFSIASGATLPRSRLELTNQFYLAGPAVDARALEPIAIDSKLGKLKCAGVTGSLDASSFPNPDNVKVQPPTFEVRLHEKAPFGVVSYTLTATEPSGDVVVLKGVLEEFGKDAASRMPNSR